MKFMIAFAAVAAMLAGCAGHSCIKVGGSYQGAGGEMEYCWNAEKTNASGAPAFDKSGGEKETIFGFSLEEVDGIIGRLKEKIGEFTASELPSSESSESSEHPVRQLKLLLKKAVEKEK